MSNKSHSSINVGSIVLKLELMRVVAYIYDHNTAKKEIVSVESSLTPLGF